METTARPSTAGAETRGAVADVIQHVFALLDAEGIAYCLSHGYQDLPRSWGTDIDIVISRSVSGDALHDLLRRNASATGAEPMSIRGLYVVLACGAHDGVPQFLVLDFAHDAACGRHVLYRGDVLLRRRQRFRNFWVPAADQAFDIELVRAVLKERIEPETVVRLRDLFNIDPSAARTALARRWPHQDAQCLATAAANGSWTAVAGDVAKLRRRFKRSDLLASPFRAMLALLREQCARIGRLLRPRGIHVALLGPDGAGKSSTIAALEEGLGPLFRQVEVRGFAPSLRQVLRRPAKSTATPHALPRRSSAASLLRAAYWSAHALASRLSLRWAKARSVLVLNDRHFVDILVDPVRYRYGGPAWALKVVWWLTPKPDLLILLTGRPEVLQARKQELSVAETARLCREYLALVRPLTYGCVIDAERPFPHVTGAAARAVLQRLHDRRPGRSPSDSP